MIRKTILEVPTPSCHASTVVFTESGVLLAWFGGTAEGDPDVGIYVTRGDGETFSAPERVSREEGVAHWNPVLWRRSDGTFALYYKVGAKISDWETYVTESADEGATWSQPKPLIAGDRSGGRGPVKNKPIRIADGTVLAPASWEKDVWRAFADRSPDDGRSFCRADYIEAPEFDGRPVGLIQPTLWESQPGVVHMLLRSNEGALYRADSADGGKTWSVAYRTAVANNNSGVDLVSLADGTLILACNPVGKNWGARTPLVLMRSADNGNTWERLYVLEDAPGEYSYPAVVADDKRIAVSYTWNRQKIAYCEISINETERA
ncbi:MAG: sialidase family protein [Clostridiaceae bacterium]|nr:sialidase family protein [Clostridiaceae bacterium]